MEQQQRQKGYRLSAFEQIVASSVGGSITALFTTPLDVVKTRLQAQSTLPPSPTTSNKISTAGAILKKETYLKGTVDAFIKITRREGLASLWRGLPPSLLMQVPATTMYFSVYEKLKGKIQGNVGSLDILKTLVRDGHISRLWVGVKPTLARDVPFSALYWGGYESSKKFLHVHTSQEGFLVNFTSGALAGSIAAVATVPFDVVKTTMQMNVDKTKAEVQSSVIQTIRQLVRQEGISALYKGVLPRAVKVAPACAIMISSYEFMKEFFALRQDVPANATMPPAGE